MHHFKGKDLISKLFRYTIWECGEVFVTMNGIETRQRLLVRCSAFQAQLRRCMDQGEASRNPFKNFFLPMLCPLWTDAWTFMQHRKSPDFVHTVTKLHILNSFHSQIWLQGRFLPVTSALAHIQFSLHNRCTILLHHVLTFQETLVIIFQVWLYSIYNMDG